ncbi:MAG: sensor domain-containing diguanylate cyclase [Proteobacteria bacterium]|nr:sensor domain-containing diguanylate cyclase [Pseudomonadota bacterium]MBU1638929.1 sensor domain-containing diguanylate cyclase [Pseudomonadota bacterium]
MDNKVEICSRQETISFIKTFMAVFVPLLVFLMMFHLTIYHGKKKQALQSLGNFEVHRASVVVETLLEHFDWIFADLNFVANKYLAASLVATHQDLVLVDIEKDLLLFSREKKIYDQIRIIDSEGREQLRINYNGGAAYTVPAKELQDKSLRYYFKDCMALESGNIYLSPLDLNIEHGEVEVPFKPIIRIGRPVLDRHGRKSGMVLLNYLGSDFISHVSDELAYPHHDDLVGSGPTMLVNAEGYWLVAPDKEDEWGFMFAHRKGRSFANRYPLEWAHISTEKNGHLLTTNGFFAFATIQHPLAAFIPEAGSFGKVISFVSAERIERIIYREKALFYLLSVVLLSFSAIVALLVATLVASKKRYELELAHSVLTDPLTGLVNRRGFQLRMEQEARRVDRYGGRMFVILGDIDHFKNINDAHGHDAGDFILKKLAGTLTASLRSTDVLCRWGGEEFMILMSGYTQEDGARVAEKLRQAVEEEIVWHNNPRIMVTMSFGVCIYRKKMNMEELLKCSNEMVATSKTNGGNQVTAENHDGVSGKSAIMPSR